MDKWKGTAVPNTGLVEKVYLNIHLSDEEITEICSKLTMKLEGWAEYILNTAESSDISLYIVDLETAYNQKGYAIINAITEEKYYVSTQNEISDEYPFVGWNPDFNGEIVVNKELTPEHNGIASGTQNELICELFSSEPIIKLKLNLDEFLTDIADSIREVKGTTDKINAQNYSTEIRKFKNSLPVLPKATDISIDNETGNITYKLPDVSKYENAGGDVEFLLSINNSEPIKVTEELYEGAAILNEGENTISIQTKVDITLYSEKEETKLTYTPPKPEIPEVATLESLSWEQISAISEAGLAESYFSVGDTKSIKLNGLVGTLELNNVELYVYILGFNHNSEIEGEGISFGTFKTASGVDVCLVDSVYNSSKSDGTKCFNINHYGNYNYGGWKGCDMRYDILGSTDVAPSGYGSVVASGRVGYDATYKCISEPVSNTLMSALPSELRSVLKPITKYSDNIAGGVNNSENISTSVDYLPLLSEYEVHGSRNYANSYEQNYQKKYSYYSLGNSKKKYKYNDTSTSASWWVRSAYYYNYDPFCYVNANGTANRNGSYYSRGVAPAFLI